VLNEIAVSLSVETLSEPLELGHESTTAAMGMGFGQVPRSSRRQVSMTEAVPGVMG
jgi:hypothetical protein